LAGLDVSTFSLSRLSLTADRADQSARLEVLPGPLPHGVMLGVVRVEDGLQAVDVARCVAHVFKRCGVGTV